MALAVKNVYRCFGFLISLLSSALNEIDLSSCVSYEASGLASTVTHRQDSPNHQLLVNGQQEYSRP